MVRLRGAAPGQPTFVFFPHAGGSALSAGRLAAALPPRAGVMVLRLPRGGAMADAVAGDPAPRRAVVAAREAARALRLLVGAAAPGRVDEPERLILVGNSYGALLAYETARLLAADHMVERLIVSGFRSPALPAAEAPLHRLPPHRLREELAARFGPAPGSEADAADVDEEALRADLEACDTYRHAHPGRLAVPIDVLHMTDDPSVTTADLLAWGELTTAATRAHRHAGGHFPWATHAGALAGTLVRLAGDGPPGNPAHAGPGHATPAPTGQDERGWM